MLSMKCLLLALWVTVARPIPIGETRTCLNSKSSCFLKVLMCPAECPLTAPKDLKTKACYIDCNSPVCKAECKSKTFVTYQMLEKSGHTFMNFRCWQDINRIAMGAVFDGKYDDHFSLVSDVNFQINARFAGLRPGGGSRDYSWIQALGVLFNQNAFTLEATHVANLDDAVKNMKFTYNEDEIIVPQGDLSRWESSDSEIIVERISETNSLLITVSDFAEISVSIVPVPKEDDMIHNDQIPNDNCFGHLEVQFKFYGLSSNVEGLLGKTYQPGFRNPGKPGPGEAMSFFGEEEKYRTASLLSPVCSSCRYSPAEQTTDQGTMDYAGGGKQQEWSTM